MRLGCFTGGVTRTGLERANPVFDLDPRLRLKSRPKDKLSGSSSNWSLGSKSVSVCYAVWTFSANLSVWRARL